MASSYTPLHSHSIYSIRDSILRVEDYVARGKELGLSSLGISDHGTMSGCFKFYKECKANDIKPIIGCELYYTPDYEYKDHNYHILVIAKNNIGLKNLYKISSMAYTIGFFRKPRISKQALFDNSEGLIVCSACCFGHIQQLVLADDKDAALDEIKSFVAHFKDDYYLEIHDHELEEEVPVREFFRQVSDDLGCNIICGTDAHYLRDTDKPIHNVFKQLAYGSVGTGADDGFNGTGYHIWTPEELSLKFTPKEISTTLEIAEKCNVSISHDRYHLPVFDTGGRNKYEYIKEKAYIGLKGLGLDTDKVYIDRLEYELGIIHMGQLEDYFLIVSDYIGWCKGNEVITGTARGSSAGSLLAYCLGVTGIDPIRHKLMFSRMLNKGRLLQYDFGI